MPCVMPGCSGVLTYAEGPGKYVYIEDQEELRRAKEVGSVGLKNVTSIGGWAPSKGPRTGYNKPLGVGPLENDHPPE